MLYENVNSVLFVIVYRDGNNYIVFIDYIYILYFWLCLVVWY